MTILAKSGHIVAAVSALLDLGCKLLSAPSGGILPRNKLLIEIGATDGTRRWRLLIYKVTSSGRNRDWERRIEITTTYQGNLKRERGFGDVVLGYDSDHDIFIGIDPIRLKHGGQHITLLHSSTLMGWNGRMRRLSKYGLVQRIFVPRRLSTRHS